METTMPGVDLVAILTGPVPAIGIGLLCLHWMRQVYEDAIRREREYAISLKEVYSESNQAQERWAERMALLSADLLILRDDRIPAITREIHALKNTLQVFMANSYRQSGEITRTITHDRQSDAS